MWSQLKLKVYSMNLKEHIIAFEVSEPCDITKACTFAATYKASQDPRPVKDQCEERNPVITLHLDIKIKKTSDER